MREIKEVRKLLFGDVKKAATYIGLARTILGQVKQQAAFGGLSQLSRLVRLPDGTQITVDTRFGQDMIEIRSPVRPGVGREEVTMPRGSLDVPALAIPPGLIVAGDYIPAVVNPVLRAVLWRSPTTPLYLTVDTGRTSATLPADSVQGISADGSIVAGIARGTYTDGAGALGFLWTGAGTESIGRIGTAATLINGLSADGRTAGGNSAVTASPGWNYRPFIWTREGGIRLLSMGSGIEGMVAAVSANGRVMVGRITTSNSPYREEVVVWYDGNPPVTIATGSLGRCAMGVSGDGKVICGQHTTGVGFDAVVRPFRWTAAGGLQLLSESRGQANAVSADGRVVVGGLYGFINEVEPGLPRVTFGGDTPHAFYWTESTGLVDLGEGVAYCASPDGTVIGGVDLGGAVLWDRQGNVTRLGGGAGHIAKVIAQPSIPGVPAIHVDL